VLQIRAMANLDNIIMLSDSYKVSHYAQYPPGTTEILSYFESRGYDADAVSGHPTVCFFGLQYFIKRYLTGRVVTLEKLTRAKEFFDMHFQGTSAKFNYDGWKYILDKHNGRLPIEIKAVPEGTEVPTSTVLFTMRNTDPECFWLSNYLETLLVQVWYPMTVATNSMYQRRMILEYLKSTGDPAGIDFKLCDFGFRGVSSVESAAVGGMAHLVNFCGTDNAAGIVAARTYYGATMPGASVPASEHSTITSWGRERELDAMRNMLVKYPTGLVACVSDSYNIYDAVEKKFGDELKSEVCKRDGVLVIRPDSGEPKKIVPELLEKLAKAFAPGTCGSSKGSVKNSKGFMVLDPHVRLIQGDGVNTKTVGEICEEVKKAGFSLDNVTFGSGGALLQQVDRDTQKVAFKCCRAIIKGEKVDVYKDPIHDKGKKSKQGVMYLVKDTSLPATSPWANGRDTVGTSASIRSVKSEGGKGEGRRSKGEKGEKGERGEKGVKGEKSGKGEGRRSKGEKGEKGGQSEKGGKGEKGETVERALKNEKSGKGDNTTIEKEYNGARVYAGDCFNLVTVCHYEKCTKRALWASDDKGKFGRADPETIDRSEDLKNDVKQADVKRDMLETVFKNGEIVKQYNFAEIRKRAASSWPGDEGCSALQ